MEEIPRSRHQPHEFLLLPAIRLRAVARLAERARCSLASALLVPIPACVATLAWCVHRVGCPVGSAAVHVHALGIRVVALVLVAGAAAAGCAAADGVGFEGCVGAGDGGAVGLMCGVGRGWRGWLVAAVVYDFGEEFFAAAGEGLHGFLGGAEFAVTMRVAAWLRGRKEAWRRMKPCGAWGSETRRG